MLSLLYALIMPSHDRSRELEELGELSGSIHKTAVLEEDPMCVWARSGWIGNAVSVNV